MTLPMGNGSFTNLTVTNDSHHHHHHINKTDLWDDQSGLGHVEVLVIVVMSVIAVIGFQGNLWIAVVILNNPGLRTSMTNLFVLNLVIVDLLASTLAMPLAVITFSYRDSNQDIQICEASGFLSTCFMLCSMLTLCIISVDRFYSIAMPLHHASHATPLRALVIVVFIWAIGVCVACLPCFGVNSYKFKVPERICSFGWAGDDSDRVFVIIIFVISFLIPSLVILAMYSSIFCIARKAARSIAPHPSESTPSNFVNPEADMSQSETSSRIVNNKQISIHTVESLAVRPPRIRIFSLSSDDSTLDSRDTNPGLNCHRTLSVSYSESEECDGGDVNPDTKSGKNCTVNNLVQSDGLHYGPKTKMDETCMSSSTCQRLHQTKMFDKESNGRCCCSCSDHSQGYIDVADKFTTLKLAETTTSANTGDGNNIVQNENLSTNKSNSIIREPSPHRLGKTDSNSSLFSRSRSSTTKQSSQTNRPSPARPNHTKAFRTVMVIVLSYLVLWGPYFVCQVHHLRGHVVSSNVQLAVSWLGFTSYVINPCLYGGMNKLIRDELSRLYREMTQRLKSFGYCMCWVCCRCSGCVTEEFFQRDQAAIYCMPWLKEEVDNDDESPRLSGQSVAGRRGQSGGGGLNEDGNDNDDDGVDDERGESFFQFLERTQDE